ncbi:MAG: hypothetical protein ACKPKO_23210, partial [Candidatus Fonsibacter sp.]
MVNKEMVHTDIINFVHRMKWRWFFRDCPKSQVLPYRRRACTVPCGVAVDPALNAWLGHLASTLNRATAEACIKSRYNREYSNVNGVLRLGRQLLAKSQWVAVPTDKDGGMALIDL